MSTYASAQPDHPDSLRGGLFAALALHLAIVIALVAYTFLAHNTHDHWGENAAQTGSIEASMVSAIPLPAKAPPVKDSVLASEDVTRTPAPQPRETTLPPPRPTDVLIKGRTPEKAITRPTPEVAVKHPQSVPDTPRAHSGDAATQLPQSTTQLKNGTATITVQDRVFGSRYAYYLQIVGRKVRENYNTGEVEAAASQGRSATLLFDIEADGTVQNLRLETRSGSTTLDSAAMRAIQRIDSFGPLPTGDHITIEDKFDFHQP